MAIAAHNRHSRLSQPKFGTNYVYDPLLWRIHIEQRDSELLAVGLQRSNLLCGNQIGDRSPSGLSRDVVIDSRNGA